MGYLKIYRKGENMANVNNKKNVKKGKRSIDKVKNVNKKNNKKEVNVKVYEKYTCYIVGLVILLLFIAVFKNVVFLPALLITIGLELFCIAYYFLDNQDKKSLVYGLFELGVAFVLAAIIYTIIKLV